MKRIHDPKDGAVTAGRVGLIEAGRVVQLDMLTETAPAARPDTAAVAELAGVLGTAT